MAVVTRWIALLVLTAVGGAMLLTWPDVKEETGPQQARSLYGYKGCAAPCALGPSYVAFRVNKLFAKSFDGGPDWGVAARRAGLPIEATPSIGAVAWYGGNRVAFVERVLSAGAVEVTELSLRRLTRRTVTRAQGWPLGFIRIAPRVPEAPAPPAAGPSTLI
jgi:surface antigen